MAAEDAILCRRRHFVINIVLPTKRFRAVSGLPECLLKCFVCCKDRTRIDLLVSQVTLKESGKLELGVLHLRPLNKIEHVGAEEQHQGHQHLLLVILVFKVWILVYLL